MAINLSYALGIHKEETLPMFDLSEQTARYAILSSHPRKLFFYHRARLTILV